MRTAAGKVFLLLCLITVLPVWGGYGGEAAAETGSGFEEIFSLPMDGPSSGLTDWKRLALLKDYNTRVVVFGTALLGVAAGVIGSFTLLRKRALMGDALSHAMLPGIGIAFMVAVAAGGSGKGLPFLLLGATLSGLLGLAVILFIRKYTRLKEDTALGVVLSVFFGGGVAILGIVQRMGQGHAAGLESFIYGKTASMLAQDAAAIGGSAVLVIVVTTLFFKELKLLCFDNEFAASLGWSTTFLDVLMMSMVVIVTVIGLQAVGLILVIAMLIIPAAAARFWTELLKVMVFISAFIGALAGAIGSVASAVAPNLPSGAMIVLCAAVLFAFSLVFGSERGVLMRWSRRRQLSLKVRRQHLLRACFELMEHPGSDGLSREYPRFATAELLRMRSWSKRELRRAIAAAVRDHLGFELADGSFALTDAGLREAGRVVRNHRLWEVYLITHADIAPSHVDRDADAIEHVLEPAMLRELEAALAQPEPSSTVPASPHAIKTPTPP